MAWQIAEEDFVNYWVRFGKLADVFKFEDAREAMGLASRKVHTKAQPGDFLVTHDGHTFFAEVKSCSSETSFPLSNIQPSQWRRATLVSAAHGSYFFYIKSEVRQEWFSVPASYFIRLKAEGFKSVKWSELSQYYWEIK
jgi:penicillin-binding protein-related factor A (putative recombinase)